MRGAWPSSRRDEKISRGSSVATTPGFGTENGPTPAGVAEARQRCATNRTRFCDPFRVWNPATPPGSGGSRSARPPANFCHPSGIKTTKRRSYVHSPTIVEFFMHLYGQHCTSAPPNAPTDNQRNDRPQSKSIPRCQNTRIHSQSSWRHTATCPGWHAPRQHPGGIQEISRGSSAATTPGFWNGKDGRPRQGSQRRTPRCATIRDNASLTPPGSRILIVAGFRGWSLRSTTWLISSIPPGYRSRRLSGSA